MKYILFLLIVLIAISCNQPIKSSKYVCNCDEKEKVALFIQNSIKSANNMSDEEMEDVVYELRKTAITVICKQTPIWVYSENYSIIWDSIPKDSCYFIMQF